MGNTWSWGFDSAKHSKTSSKANKDSAKQNVDLSQGNIDVNKYDNLRTENDLRNRKHDDKNNSKSKEKINTSINSEYGKLNDTVPNKPTKILTEDNEKSSVCIDVESLTKSTWNRFNKRSSINPKSAFQALDLEEVPYWKNQCLIDIDQVKYVWIYSSYTGNGWWHMTPEFNNHVEKLYQMWNNKEDFDKLNHFKLNGSDFKYNFDKMCQINRDTKTNRTIRRLDIDKIREIEKNYISLIDNSEYVWKYRDSKGLIEFMPQLQEEIEAAYFDFQANNQSDKYVHYEFKYPNGYDYQLNFRKMTQINRQTGVRRNIERIINSENTKNKNCKLSNETKQSTIDLNELYNNDSQQTLKKENMFSSIFSPRQGNLQVSRVEIDRVELDQLNKVEDGQVNKVENDQVNKVENNQVNKVESDQVNKVENDQVNKVESDQVNKVEDDQVNNFEVEQVNNVEVEQANNFEVEQANKVEEDQINKVKDDLVNNVENDQVNNFEVEQVTNVEVEQANNVEINNVEVNNVEIDQVNNVEIDQVNPVNTFNPVNTVNGTFCLEVDSIEVNSGEVNNGEVDQVDQVYPVDTFNGILCPEVDKFEVNNAEVNNGEIDLVNTFNGTFCSEVDKFGVNDGEADPVNTFNETLCLKVDSLEADNFGVKHVEVDPFNTFN